jgi:polyphosphate kinase 2 (PPK2 family)
MEAVPDVSRPDTAAPRADGQDTNGWGAAPADAVPPDLDGLDLSPTLDKKEELRRLQVAQRRLLQLRLFTAGLVGATEAGPPICVVMEGWDAAGKGGAIKRLVAPLDVRHYQLAYFAKPTPIEKAHTFLWRFYPDLPGIGDLTVYDRSWYGRVLVERVEQFATDEEWGRAYQEIVDFERSLTSEGAIMIKLWLQISHAEQGRRFESRQADPLRSWKLGPEDWRNRDKRPQYDEAVRDMLARTHTATAPWDLVAAESKRYARVRVIETVIARIEDGMRRVGTKPPAPITRSATLADQAASP